MMEFVSFRPTDAIINGDARSWCSSPADDETWFITTRANLLGHCRSKKGDHNTLSWALSMPDWWLRVYW